MTNLPSLSKTNSPWRNNATIVFLVVAFFGFLDATYLTAEHYLAVPLPCTLTQGCEVVTTSAYSMFGPLPVALLGALYYMAAFFLMVAYRETGDRRALLATGALVTLGLAFSAWFTYVQFAILKAFCQYCLLSAFFTTILFILAALLVAKNIKTIPTIMS